MRVTIPTDRFAVFGDLHLNSTTPASRLDDYPSTTIRKLNDARQILIEKGVSVVVILGDVFHKNQQSIVYLNRVVEALARYRESGIKVYSIAGNHDLAFEKIEMISHSPLQTLFASGLVEHVDELDLGRVLIKGFDYPVAITPAPEYKGFTVCVAHRFYDNTLSEFSLFPKNIKHLDYDVYCLGHDHVLYPNEYCEGHTIIRPGSFTRGTSHAYNLDREPSFDVIYYEKGDVGEDRLRFERCVIPYQPAAEVFSVQAMDKEKKVKDDLTEMSERIDELIERMDQRTTSSSLYEIIDATEMRPEIKILIEKYLETMGVFREITK